MIQRVKGALTAHEGMMTCILVAVAIVLLAVAIFGRAEHKAMILIAVVL